MDGLSSFDYVVYCDDRDPFKCCVRICEATRLLRVPGSSILLASRARSRAFQANKIGGRVIQVPTGSS